MKHLLAATTAAALFAGATAASAATYTFSFDNVDGPVAGTVSGTIELADGDGTFAATSVIVDSAPAALGYTLSLDFLDPTNGFSNLVENTFIVAGGTIVDAAFGAVNANEGILFDTTGGFGFSFMNVVGTASINGGVLDTGSTTLTFAPAAVPLPASLPLLLAGLGGIAAVRKRKTV